MKKKMILKYRVVILDFYEDGQNAYGWYYPKGLPLDKYPNAKNSRSEINFYWEPSIYLGELYSFTTYLSFLKEQENDYWIVSHPMYEPE